MHRKSRRVSVLSDKPRRQHPMATKGEGPYVGVEAQMAERLSAGPGYVESGYVFTSEIGEPIRPDSLTHAFAKATRAAGVPDIGVHGLRHTAATLLLAAGVQPHVVQERLGHADISITLGLYSHALPKQRADAARLLGNAIYGG